MLNDIAIDRNYHKDLYGFELSSNEILNFLTHRKIWEEFLTSKEPYCMIVESNVRFNASIYDIQHSIEELYEDWDLFFPYDMEEMSSDMQVSGMKLLNPNLREISNRDSYLLGYKWGNSIYFISKKGVEKLLQCNTIKNRLDNAMVSLSLNEELNIYYSSVNWLNTNQIDWREWPDRIKLIWATIYENSSWTPERKKKARDMLKIISQTGMSTKINLILQGGTHLGYVRHGEIMPWDDDIDIGIEENLIEVFLEELKSHEEYQFGAFIEPLTDCPYYKIWRKDGENIDGHIYKFPFVDLWMYNIVEDDFIFKNGIICPNSAKKDLEEIVFEGALFKIPYNSIEILDTRYVDWRTKIRVYSWSHRYEKHYFPLLCVPIQVDSNGKLE
jgi:GR25 family glycosyltransferase involved in LPS biosynthesis